MFRTEVKWKCTFFEDFNPTTPDHECSPVLGTVEGVYGWFLHYSWGLERSYVNGMSSREGVLGDRLQLTKLSWAGLQLSRQVL